MGLGATYDMAGNPVIAATIPIDIPDGVPPEVSSVIFEMRGNTLTVTFSEPLDHAATNYDMMSLLGASSNVTLDRIDGPTAAGREITFALNATHLDTLGGPPASLAVKDGAVSDAAGNRIDAVTIPVLIEDTTPAACRIGRVPAGWRPAGDDLHRGHQPCGHQVWHDGHPGRVESANLTLAETEWLPLEETLTIVLNRTHLDGTGYPQHILIPSGAVVDMAGNPIIAVTVPVTIPDTVPPGMVSATYHISTGLLEMAFSEPLDHAVTDYTLLSLVGPSANLTLAHVDRPAAAGGTIEVQLNATHLETLGGVPSAVSVRMAAVYDAAGNPVQVAIHPVTIPDVVPPEVASATLEMQSGLLEITFSEAIDHTATNYDAVTILGASSNITLDQIDGLTASNRAISAVLNATHLDTLGGSPASLAIKDGAVSDAAGNRIDAVTIPIIRQDTTPPHVVSAPRSSRMAACWRWPSPRSSITRPPNMTR